MTVIKSSHLQLGNDLSPIQPRWTPPNVRFEVDDIEAEWAYDAPFDYIHSRYMLCSIADWPKYMSQAFKYYIYSLQGLG